MKKDEKLIKKLEDALFKMSRGFSFKEIKTVQIKNEQYDEIGNIEITKTVKYIKPDIRALMFALTNLDPANWQNNKVDESEGIDDIVIIDDLEKYREMKKNGTAD